ncbi:MAG: sigma-54 dependent transcriptional regulator [Verrucomicrobia bacterium]|nr:sigma-54 dependent transcriptional regulator [Verrucomicrobiota bacterium]MCF7707659.1 sigma-54 dependent transcriptional regulator [Verrucomicrobiota bacterium]
MKPKLPPLLLIDDEKNMRLSLQTVMSEEGYETRAVESAEEGLELLKTDEFFMAIADARLGGMSGYEFLEKVKERWPQFPVLIITAYATPKLAVEAIKAGAIDYLAKPFAPEELIHAVTRCAERYQLIKENIDLRAGSGQVYRLDQIIGNCPQVNELKQLIKTVAPTDATVFILGESGTGKELVAGAIHALSKRANAKYVRINCAAIPEMLLESELFGHEKGSFTGAHKQKTGRVEEADQGTIFLDEIGDMSRPLQAKLLRFLEDGSFTRVGGNEERRVDVRLIAATNRDIVHAIRENLFREDLFHRLNVVQLRSPPLRERGDDILLLAEHFINQFSISMNKPVKKLADDAVAKLKSHHWPGNIRELKNVIERAVILETQGEINADHLPDFRIESKLGKSDDGMPPSFGLEEILSVQEKEIILRALEQNRFSLTKSSAQLKISKENLVERLQKLNVHMESTRDNDVVIPLKVNS